MIVPRHPLMGVSGHFNLFLNLLSEVEDPHDLIVDEVEDHEEIDTDGRDNPKVAERDRKDRLNEKDDDSDKECDPSDRVPLVHRIRSDTETYSDDQRNKVSSEVIGVVDACCKVCCQVGKGKDECQYDQHID